MPIKLAGDAEHVEQIGSWFTVEVAGAKTTFTDVGGLSIEVGVVDQQVTGPMGDTISLKVMGTTSYGDITLKRNFSKDRTFYDWAQEVVQGKHSTIRRNGAIALHGMDGAETGRWEFTMAWPKKWSVSDLDVGSDDPMVEEVTLAIEGLKRVK
jgi:phage tail-like protein